MLPGTPALNIAGPFITFLLLITRNEYFLYVIISDVEFSILDVDIA